MSLLSSNWAGFIKRAALISVCKGFSESMPPSSASLSASPAAEGAPVAAVLLAVEAVGSLAGKSGGAGRLPRFDRLLEVLSASSSFPCRQRGFRQSNDYAFERNQGTLGRYLQRRTLMQLNSLSFTRVTYGHWHEQMQQLKIIIIIIIMSVFLERLSMWNMLSCAEQVQIQNMHTRQEMIQRTITAIHGSWRIANQRWEDNCSSKPQSPQC